MVDFLRRDNYLTLFKVPGITTLNRLGWNLLAFQPDGTKGCVIEKKAQRQPIKTGVALEEIEITRLLKVPMPNSANFGIGAHALLCQ